MKQPVGTLISRWIFLTGHRAQDKLSFTRDSSDAGRGVRRKEGVLTRRVFLIGEVVVPCVLLLPALFITPSIFVFFFMSSNVSESTRSKASVCFSVPLRTHSLPEAEASE